MSTHGGQPPTGGGPSIRLNLNNKSDSSKSSSSAAAAAGQASSRSASPPRPKKRRFEPPSLKPNTAQAHNLQVLHQKSALSFLLHRSSSATAAGWYASGVTTLYVVDDSSDVKTAGKTDTSTGITTFDRQFALHLRGTCNVTSVEVQSLTPSTARQTQDATFVKGDTSFQHFDPLERVLLKPASSYTMDDVIQLAKSKRHEADSQSGRGAAGMTNAIRAAGIASNMGELRIASTITTNSSNPPGEDVAANYWKHDMKEPIAMGDVMTRLQTALEPRSSMRKAKRMDFVATTLAKNGFKASKITVRYDILLGGADVNSRAVQHLGGIHALTTKETPHVYTTTGVYGDHEGARSWIPILDSAATRHRASHDMTIKVTAPMNEGLSVIGFGEDFGASEAILHDRLTVQSLQAPVELDSIERELGKDHVDWLRKTSQAGVVDDISLPRPNTPHVIPPELSGNGKILSIDAILATSVWTSCSWLPISPRSVGFAIGPFRVLEDPEYFASLGEGEDSGESDVEDNDDEKEEKDKEDRVQLARDNGEGVRQAYFAPIFARKHIHANASKILLSDTKFKLSSMSKSQRELCEALDQSVLTATIGVPTRALSLMRDVLALPSFRTVSYTQVWIPDAVHGGSTSGALHCCPEALNNPFLGGSIMDSRLLPPINHRLPFSHGGRVLQFLQARCAVRGWILSAIPLGGRDDVGNGYIHTLLEGLIMSLYERGHGAFGEGGGRGSAFFTKRYAAGSGLNSSNLDFLPIQNIEETDFDIVVGGIVGAVPVEDRNNDQLWRSASNGTESHTSAMDEFAIRQLFLMDAVNALERGSDKDRPLPTPSMGWMGSHLSLTFLSSNANSSSELGCGAVELRHPIGGLPYRSLKGDLVRRIVEGRAGIANFIRLVRATFVAAHLTDMGHCELKYPPEKKNKSQLKEKAGVGENDTEKEKAERPKPRFVVCVNEILKKKGLSHTLFTRALQNISGRVREAQLLGTLVDVERDSKDPRTNRPFVDPEGFPNSFVRGSSELYLRVGVHVEPAKDASGSGIAKGIQLYSFAEPVIPEGGIAYGGPITFRVVENEGQFREFVKDLSPDGSRRDWGSITLHAKPVTLPKAQTAASGIIESASTKGSDVVKAGDSNASLRSPLGLVGSTGGVFTDSNIHKGGYQAIELIRITNLTPLLWVRVDPMCLYGGRISVFQPDACLAEMLFHDGDAGAQVDALRALAERPLKIQGSVKVTSVYDVRVAELPVRVLGDCLRGTPALHSSLPHPPAVRAQAALAIAQWQNNKAPKHRNDMAQGSWVGLQLLIQYFRERFYNNGTVMPVKFNRVIVKKNDVENTQTVANPEGTTPSLKANEDDGYRYLDDFDEGEERAAVLEEADEVDVEEDGEYRVRSAVITAIASVRAKDGMTPPYSIRFLETVLEAVDAEMTGNIVTPDEEVLMEKKRRKVKEEQVNEGDDESIDEVEDVVVNSFPYASNTLVADALLALCHVNASPEFITDPATGKLVQSSKRHPVSKLMEICRRWLDWELYRERIRGEKELESQSGISGECYSTVSACAITALSSLSILRQSTTDPQPEAKILSSEEESLEATIGAAPKMDSLEEVATASFYISIYDSKPVRSDVTRAACAQAIACIYCAADRFENSEKKPVGLLNALEFIFDRILEPHTSPGLRQTLAELMVDACSGKICSWQRVGSVGGRNDLVTSTARLLNGPLGASHGGDSGSAAVCNINPISYPAASAVNDGARRGLRLISRAGHPKDIGISEDLIVRVAIFATNLWRTINGEPMEIRQSSPGSFKGDVGLCAVDGHLRCTLLALWQWLWPRGCFPVMQVQVRKPTEWTRDYRELGVDKVMRMSEEEKAALLEEESSLSELHRLVSIELDRQIWRGEMATKAYEIFKASKSANSIADAAANEQGIGQPLPPIKRDASFKQGGWIASSAQQRRAAGLDGGTAVTKIRVRKSADA